MQENLQFLKSSRGGQLVVLNDYLFNIQLKRNESSYYKCEHKTCNVRLTLKNNELSNVNGAHEHAPNLERLQKIKLNNRLKERSAEDFSQSVPGIYR